MRVQKIVSQSLEVKEALGIEETSFVEVVERTGHLVQLLRVICSRQIMMLIWKPTELICLAAADKRGSQSESAGQVETFVPCNLQNCKDQAMLLVSSTGTTPKQSATIFSKDDLETENDCPTVTLARLVMEADDQLDGQCQRFLEFTA